MTARYLSGVASSPNDLLDKIVAFLNLQGWTTVAYAAEGAGKRGHLSKNGVFVNFRSAVNESVFPNYDPYGGGSVSRTGIGLNVGTGYTSTNAWNNQPGVPSSLYTSRVAVDAALAPLSSGTTFAYHLFDDGADNIIVAAESSSSGAYSYLGFGKSVDKQGNWTGGAYFYANGLADSYRYAGFYETPFSSCGFVRADVDTTSGAWLGVGATLGRAVVSSSIGSTQYPNHALIGPVGVSTMSGQANLLPLNVLAARDGGGYSYLASLPNIYRCEAVGNGFSAGVTYTVGGDSYVLFPSFAVKKLG